MNRAPDHLLSIVRIATGLLFFQHGAEKMWGFAGGRVDLNFATMHGFAGPLEVIGGALLVLGLFTRPVAFILCGEMAVAYFTRWAPRGFWPVQNGGEEAVLFCFVFLWLFTAGGGSWSFPQRGQWNEKLAGWEPHGRSVARAILAFTFSLHGFRHVFGVLAAAAGRRAAVPMALDRLPAMLGFLEIAGGLLLLMGLFSRPVAAILSAEALAAYLYSALPRGWWPIRNGGDEVLLYMLVFLYCAAAGGGAWSLDHLIRNRRPAAAQVKRAGAMATR